MYRTLFIEECILVSMLVLAVNAMKAGHARWQPMPSMPKITADPVDFLEQVQPLQRHELHRRQALVASPIDLTVTNAPDATCGYLSAEVGVPITCTNGDQCAWALLQKDSGVIRCGTEIKVKCYESSKAVDPTLCNDVCQSDTMNLLCTDSDTPYCRTYAFPNGIRDFRCASSSLTKVQSAEHTYYGQKNPNFTTRYANDAVETTQSDQVTERTSKESAEPTTITRVAASTNSAGHDNDNKSSSAPIGAIVGGVVGGVALIGMVMLGIFFVLRQKRSKTEQASGPINPPTMNFAPQNMDPAMINQKMIASPHVQATSAVTSSMFGPPSGGSWGGEQNSLSPPPIYEAPGQETQVHEIGESADRSAK